MGVPPGSLVSLRPADLSADPALAVPVRPQPPASVESEVERVGLAQPGRREDLEAACGVRELELAIGPIRRALEHPGAPATAPCALRPDVHGATLRLDVVAD